MLTLNPYEVIIFSQTLVTIPITGTGKILLKYKLKIINWRKKNAKTFKMERKKKIESLHWGK